ncbi:Golgi to ER traffic protein 4 homolog isoform X4 [Tympanuchus pallidicinctus]|uniref:Golgi to ER traffic protein 4 homolog isoform X4 n=1 Tax=Lagopus leucura TaxID=30410 RepID=UPI001C66BF99|nr:Golgi to ER traffic protein 4 homolog isoform X4 [Lagopus leucura]XP_052535854.1 Golgi to ER traffic protein 4 homolog isoform X4 [Tympanuchus pallidicinctus]
MAAAIMAAEQEAAKGGGRNRGGVQRVEGKLRASVEKGDYYEAHQMYRTLFFRYMSQGKYAEARELMYSGALLFFSHNQQNSAADLSMLVLESLEKSDAKVSDDLLDGEGCANMLVEYSSSRGYRSEVDMFVAQAVLQFLCLKNKTSASVVFTTYTQKHPSIEKGPPFVQPLLNFIWFLLLAVDGGKLTVFTVLCEQYQPSLKRDPMYNEYLDRIGQLFFGVPPKQTSSYGGLLGNLLNSLMGTGEDDDTEDGQEDSSPIELD